MWSSHSIKLVDGSEPKRLSPYRLRIVIRGELDRQIDELLESGMIVPSNSPFSHPIVCVTKKGGGIRLCVDFTYLNKGTVSDIFSMPNLEELIYEIGQANYISTLDLTKGYWQVPMEESSQDKTAYVTHRGCFMWKVTPFGLKNASSTFQRLTNKLLERHKGYACGYIDDIAVYSNSWEEHVS